MDAVATAFRKDHDELPCWLPPPVTGLNHGPWLAEDPDDIEEWFAGPGSAMYLQWDPYQRALPIEIEDYAVIRKNFIKRRISWPHVRRSAHQTSKRAQSSPP